MAVKLKFIELENFKSYQGFKRIGPLFPFMAIIGPNGSGKSNFMDAISFVMGEKTNMLRVKRLTDLIHGASVGRPISSRASVSAIFEVESEEGLGQKKFTRSVIGGSTEHKIDGDNVTSQVYLAELEKIGINAKAKNFMVFQGSVESIAMKTPKERSAMFEVISGSGVLKEDYDKLKADMMAAEEETQITFQWKKFLLDERSAAKVDKENAEKYMNLKDDLKYQQMELLLFRLYHNERVIDDMKKQIGKKNEEYEKIEKTKEGAKKAFEDANKQADRKTRDLDKLNQDLWDKEAVVALKKPDFIKSKEKTQHLKMKVDRAEKSLKEAETAWTAHQTLVLDLESERMMVERKIGEVEEELSKDINQSSVDNVILTNDQMEMYQRLKEKVSMESSRYMSELDSINREHRGDLDKLEDENRRKGDVENKMKNKSLELEAAQNRLNKLTDNIMVTESHLDEQKKQLQDLDVGSSKSKIDEVTAALEEVIRELGEVRVDKYEEYRWKKKQEIVEIFKGLFPGVYDRLINMSQPIHKKYNVAITKQLGRYMEAIVVDTEQTARQCIQYLKEQMLESETFLPLDYIQANPLKERLRNITNPPGVKLLHDVLYFEPADIKRAILYVTNNSLVCDTPEDAMKVAYELENNENYDAVALDGTFYQKSGIISGGSVDLARRAKRWDEKQVDILTARKETLSEELRVAMKNSRKESEIQSIQTTVQGLETRLKYLRSDRERTSEKIGNIRKEMEDMRNQLEMFSPTIREIEVSMSEREKVIKSNKEEMNSVEDRVFDKFCAEIGIKNIRQYEESELRSQQEREKKRLEYENEVDRITTKLEYEQEREDLLQRKVRKFERMVEDVLNQLQASEKTEEDIRKEIDKDMIEIDKLRSVKRNLKTQLNNMGMEVEMARNEVSGVQKLLTNISLEINKIEANLDSEKSRRHTILNQCKMDGINIPVRSGRMMEDEDDPNTEVIMHEEEEGIEFDYSSLNTGLKVSQLKASNCVSNSFISRK